MMHPLARSAAKLALVILPIALLTGCARSRWAVDPPLSDLSGISRQPTTDSSSGAADRPSTIVRYQDSNPVYDSASAFPASAYSQITPGSRDLPRQPMPTSGVRAANASSPIPSQRQGNVQPVQYNDPNTARQAYQAWGAAPGNTAAMNGGAPVAADPYGQAVRPVGTSGSAGPRLAQAWGTPNVPPVGAPAVPGSALPPSPIVPNWPGSPAVLPPGNLVPPGYATGPPFADVVVNVQEAPTGRLMIGAAVNSDAGVTGQIIVDERNFDWRRVPRNWDDLASGRAFRGAGQQFRVEALPGSQFQRYSVSFTEPFLLNTRVSLDLSGYLFDRSWFDWNEGRQGGRVGLGYRITPDLSASLQMRLEEVDITDPRVPGIPELDAALGKNDVYGGRVALAHDTRDTPFAPTQGHFLEFSFEQVFGNFDYPRGMIDYRRYFLITERPDGSGRHVLGFSNRLGITGSDTPIFDNFFAGGYSTLRGFDVRGASPNVGGVYVGGELMFLGSVEYLFPITADDMLKGVAFVDYGTVEQDVEINSENYRVALGAGLRINIPAMGPAPIAIDFAVPVARADTDDIQNVSFFVGFSR